MPIALDATSDADAPAELDAWLYAGAPLRPCESDMSQDAPLHCYALLDPVRSFGLAEMAQASGLECVPLFFGEEDEQAETGPLLVRLERGNVFAKRLLSGTADPYQEDPPWFLWKKAPALYVRSRLELPDLKKHFRRFTMAQDEDQKRLFHRFWDAGCFEDFLVAHQIAGSRIEALFSNISSFVV